MPVVLSAVVFAGGGAAGSFLGAAGSSRTISRSGATDPNHRTTALAALILEECGHETQKIKRSSAFCQKEKRGRETFEPRFRRIAFQ
jgi:hypothetical protein